MALRESLLLLVRRGSQLDYIDAKVDQSVTKKADNNTSRTACQKPRYKETREKRLKKQCDGYASEMQKKNLKSGRKFLGLALQSIKKTPRNLSVKDKERPSKRECRSAEPQRHGAVPISVASGYFIESKTPLRALSSKNSTKRTRVRTTETSRTTNAGASSDHVLPKIILSQEESSTTEQDFTVGRSNKYLLNASWLQVGYTRSLESLQKSTLLEDAAAKGQTRIALNPLNRASTPGYTRSENRRNVTWERFRDHSDARTRMGKRQHRNFNTSTSLSAPLFPQREHVSDSETESSWNRMEDFSRSESCLVESSLAFTRVDSWTADGTREKLRARSIEVFIPSVETAEV